MLKIGSVVFSKSKGEIQSIEVVNELRNKIIFEDLFNPAWEILINPWIDFAYTTLNLRTGKIEGNDEFSMCPETPYLILFKVPLNSLIPKEILNDVELEEYEMVEMTLQQFCEEFKVDVKQRTKTYYQSYWKKAEWYIDSVIEEKLLKYYASRETVEIIHDEILIR